ncbi:hypothetical protein EKM05_07050 [Flavobacterium sp. GSP27]|uniref:hypothetical protein n=1 Tax=Flavobacterium sp. GSP27 TaxID=2497489 RepID=UPI000F82C641|nr:hypothetical protein [Flavobacterium sp. GSP27]RTY88478.1 hypothetical protein EKL32_25265 [Flavobacterium sp. GSN2]RTZ09667.1 hypothetical protein EKM05_07050 [Flavobacterium sp. GSP27]
MEIEDVIDIHLEKDFFFAIAVGIDQDGFTHSSIIYKWDDKIKTLDFYLGKIRNHLSYGDLGNSDYIFVKYNRDFIPDDFAIQIPSLCELIVEKNSLINFGITYNSSSFDFDEQDNLILLGDDFGLTCSTFIISIFQTVGISLIEFGSWKQREDDLLWHQNVLDFFIAKNKEDSKKYPDKILKHFQNNAGCFRFRPEEVASATANNTFPSNFDYCSEYGNRLIFALKNGKESYNHKFPLLRNN